MSTWADSLTKEEAQAIVRKVMGRQKQSLSGDELEHTLTMLMLVDPVRESNNQHTITYEYEIGGDEYHVTWWPSSDTPAIDHILPDE